MKQKKKSKKKKHGEFIPLAWYTPENWELLRHSAADARSLETTWEEWREHADDTIRILTTSGYRVRTVDVNVSELITWCKRQNRPLDSEARADFVAEKLEKRPPKEELE